MSRRGLSASAPRSRTRYLRARPTPAPPRPSAAEQQPLIVTLRGCRAGVWGARAPRTAAILGAKGGTRTLDPGIMSALVGSR
jgi:hypothetical protein